MMIAVKKRWSLPRRLIGLVAAGVAITTLAVTARGAVAPGQRGHDTAAQAVATSLVSVCGLAVMLVVEPQGQRAALYAGEAMASKLRELGLQDAQGSGYDLANVYEPINSACHAIRAEHERRVRDQAQQQRPDASPSIAATHEP